MKHPSRKKNQKNIRNNGMLLCWSAQLSFYLLVQPLSESFQVPLNPANIFLHIVQSNLCGSQLRRLFFNRLKKQLHLRVRAAINTKIPEKTNNRDTFVLKYITFWVINSDLIGKISKREINAYFYIHMKMIT